MLPVPPKSFVKYRSTYGAPEGGNRNGCVIGGGDGITFICALLERYERAYKECGIVSNNKSHDSNNTNVYLETIRNILYIFMCLVSQGMQLCFDLTQQLYMRDFIQNMLRCPQSIRKYFNVLL